MSQKRGKRSSSSPASSPVKKVKLEPENFPKSLLWTTIYTPDVQKSAKFFQEAFNFTPGWNKEEWLSEWQELKPQEKGTTPLSFHRLKEDEKNFSGGEVTFSTGVADLKKFHAHITTLEGVKVLSEPIKQHWGGYIATYQSPEGVKFSVMEMDHKMLDEHNVASAASQSKAADKGKETENADAGPKGSGICHLEIPCENLDRAMKFYGDLFGWTFRSHSDDYHIFKCNDTSSGTVSGGGMYKCPDRINLPVAYLQVEDIDAKMKAIKEHGGVLLKDPSEIGGNMGHISSFKDSEGNAMSLYMPPKKH